MATHSNIQRWWCFLKAEESETKYVDIYTFLNAWLENSIYLASSATPGMLPRTSLTHCHRRHPDGGLHEGWRLEVGWPAGSLQFIWTWAAGTFLLPCALSQTTPLSALSLPGASGWLLLGRFCSYRDPGSGCWGNAMDCLSRMYLMKNTEGPVHEITSIQIINHRWNWFFMSKEICEKMII